MKRGIWFIILVPVVAGLVYAALMLLATRAAGPSADGTEIVTDRPPEPGLAPGSAALRAYINPETGELEVSNVPHEAKLDAQTLRALRRDTEGLKPTYHPDGSVSVYLDGRFQSLSVLRIGEDGKKVVCSEDVDRIDRILRGLPDEEVPQAQTPEVR